MLYIQKEKCPEDIQARIDRLTGTKAWAALPEVPGPGQPRMIRDKYFDKMDKRRVREALIAEQKGLCAYCMCRIVNDGKSTTIEHFVPLSRSKAGAMSYRNWMAVCNGGRNAPKTDGERVICCDAKKNNMIARLNPLNERHMAGIAYYDDGTIYYGNKEDPEYEHFDRDLNVTFALNGVPDPKTRRSRKDTSTGIVKQRKDAYRSFFDALMEMVSADGLTADDLLRFRESLLSEEELEPFVGVKLYVLDMFLDMLGRT